MDFYTLLDQVVDLLRSRRRVSYRALKRQFGLDDDYLEDLKAELIKSQRQAVDEDGDVLVWTGNPEAPPAAPPLTSPPAAEADHLSQAGVPPPAASSSPDAERRQLTVLFCDLVDSTGLASQLDPEDLREVVRAYQSTCAEVIQHFDGHIAQYLGDGLLIYFGYPLAHEDDVQRAVRAGLGMIEALGTVNTRLEQQWGMRLAVRIGIHTGLVVVGDIGGGGRTEQLALGETPNLAARLQGLAAPNTVVISATTAGLVEGYFLCHALGAQDLKGVSQPMDVYHVLQESGTQTRLDVAAQRGLTPLVGRDAEVTVLLEQWTEVKDGRGQVVLLQGEPGIGKSRLVQVLKEQIAQEPHTRWEWRGSPYYHNTALYPLIEWLHRALHWQPLDPPEAKQAKLEQALRQSALPLAETVPLIATLLSLSLRADDYPPLTLSPQRQKQKTFATLLALLVEATAHHPVLLIVEDLHWVDPSTVAFLSLVVDHAPTARLYGLYTFRPEFTPPWAGHAHLTSLALSRLSPSQVERMIEQVAGGKALPAEVRRHIVAKTDGVPLFVEELVKTLLASDLVQAEADHYVVRGPLPPLAIPATLQDALMARLDRLAPVKALAQLGAVLGREFTYTLLRTVAPGDEVTVQQGLAQLVDAELLSQRGLPPQATYVFKHALIREAAYQSLLKSTRQQVHQRVAQVLAAQFPEIVATQPELLAQHYTEAGLTAEAIPYWQRAGQHASDRSAYLEAISHATTGIALLATLPETPARTQQALTLHTTLGAALLMTKGHAAPEVEHAYTQAYALCQQVGETPELVPVLLGLYRFYGTRAQFHTARELADTLLRLAHRAQDPALAVIAHQTCGAVWLATGVLPAARRHFEAGLARYTPDQHRAPAFRSGNDSGGGPATPIMR
jgi:class 3 adenylate cyclase